MPAYKIETFNELTQAWQTVETTTFVSKAAAWNEIERRERKHRTFSASWKRRVVPA